MAKLSNRLLKTKEGKNNTALIVAMIIAVIVATGATFALLLQIYKTDTYYVLKENVPAQTQITPDMLTPVVTSENSAPTKAISLSDVQKGGVYSKIALEAGEVVSYSSVGSLNQINSDVPDSWVVTSFNVSSDNVASGRIEKGSHFDIIVVSDKGSFYPFVNVEALDVKSTSGTVQNEGKENASTASQTNEYTVAMTPENAAKLQQIIFKYGSENIRLTLSPKQNSKSSSPRFADYKNQDNQLFNQNPEDTPINGSLGSENRSNASDNGGN